VTTWTVPATIARVVDADTLALVLDLGWHITLTTNARVAGIDAPELSTVEGKAARDFVRELLPVGAAVTFLSRSLDKYGRPLGSVTFADGMDLATVLLQAGHAVTYDGGPR
jgi:micrococcal nuclease